MKKAKKYSINTKYKKLLCILMAIALIVASLSISAIAGNEIVTVEVEGEQCMTYGGQKVSQSNMMNYLTDGTDVAGQVIYSAYSLLDTREKDFYDRIVSTPPGTMSFEIEYSPYLSSAEFDAIDFTAIMYAVCLDHPEIFWYNGYSYGYSYIKSTGQVAAITYNLSSPVVQGTSTPVYNASDIPSFNTAMWNKFHQIASELNLANLTGYKFIKVLHDYLCNNVDYILDNRSCFDPYGTLVNGDAVCQGYAETFKMFCDYYNIPVVNIKGTGNGGAHMWNAVQMKDGKWYLLDITWDDQSPSIYYDFFLVGLNTKDTYFGGKAFNVSHISDGSQYLPALNYATTAYVHKSEQFEQTYNHYVYEDTKYVTLSPFDVEAHGVIYNEEKITDIDYSTGSKFTTSDGKTWTVVIAGDLDCDGKVSVTDYQESINKALRGNTTVQTVDDAAADVCRDGCIDALDAHMLQLMQSGLRTDVDVA